MARRSSRRKQRDALFAQRHYQLWSRRIVSPAAMAVDGRAGGAQRRHAVWPDDSFSLYGRAGFIAERSKKKMSGREPFIVKTKKSASRVSSGCAVYAGWDDRAKPGWEEARFAARRVRWRGERLEMSTHAFRSFPARCSPNGDEHAGHDCESGADGHDFNSQGRHRLNLSILSYARAKPNLA